MSPEISSPQAEILRVLGPLEGATIPGGCDKCNAEQRVEPIAAGVWRLGIYHEPGCPFLAELEAQHV